MPKHAVPRLPMLAAALLVAGCTNAGPGTTPPRGFVSLPPEVADGPQDPVRAAVLNTSYQFSNVGNLAGRPADAAQAVAEYEYLASDLAVSPRWRNVNPLIVPQLTEGLKELRPAAGIAPDAPAQPVVTGLYAAASALRQGDQMAAERALSAPAFPGGGRATLQRLGALPAMPRVASAVVLAEREILRPDERSRR